MKRIVFIGCALVFAACTASVDSRTGQPGGGKQTGNSSPGDSGDAGVDGGATGDPTVCAAGDACSAGAMASSDGINCACANDPNGLPTGSTCYACKTIAGYSSSCIVDNYGGDNWSCEPLADLCAGIEDLDNEMACNTCQNDAECADGDPTWNLDTNTCDCPPQN